MEEIVDDNVLTLAGLSSDPLKENTSRQNRAVDGMCKDSKKALTSELAAKRMKTENQLSRIDGVDTKRLRETLSKDVLHTSVLASTPFPICVVSSVARKMTPAWKELVKEKIAYLATHLGTNIAMALPIQVCGSQNTGSQTVVLTLSTYNFLSRMTPSSEFSRCNSTFVFQFCIAIVEFPNLLRAFYWNYRVIFSNSDLQIVTGHTLHCKF